MRPPGPGHQRRGGNMIRLRLRPDVNNPLPLYGEYTRKDPVSGQVEILEHGVDLEFVCQDGIVSAHKIFVCNVSPHLAALFSGQPAGEVTQMIVPDFCVKNVKQALQFIYAPYPELLIPYSDFHGFLRVLYHLGVPSGAFNWERVRIPSVPPPRLVFAPLRIVPIYVPAVLVAAPRLDPAPPVPSQQPLPVPRGSLGNVDAQASGSRTLKKGDEGLIKCGFCNKYLASNHGFVVHCGLMHKEVKWSTSTRKGLVRSGKGVIRCSCGEVFSTPNLFSQHWITDNCAPRNDPFN